LRLEAVAGGMAGVLVDPGLLVLKKEGCDVESTGLNPLEEGCPLVHESLKLRIKSGTARPLCC